MKRPSNHIIDPVNPECAVTAPDGLQSSTSQFSVTTPSGAAHDAPVGGVAVNFGDLIPDDAFHFVDSVDVGTVTTTLDSWFASPANPLAVSGNLSDLPARPIQVTIEDVSNGVSDANTDHASNGPLLSENTARALGRDDAFLVAAAQTVPGGDNGWAHILTGDSSDGNQDSTNDLWSVADDSIAIADVIVRTAANSSFFQYSASGHVDTNLGGEMVGGISFAGGATATAASFASETFAPIVFVSAAHLGGPITGISVSPTGATGAQLLQALDESGLSVNGSGITVGVLSDSFNNLGGAAADEADGALPPAADINVIEDLASGGTDEGRAMMQIIHDIAPGANLAFYTAFNSEQDFANGILALAAAGCKVICDDVSYYDEPFFQNGVIAQAIQTVEAEGVTYVTAAGNNGSAAYQAAWTPFAHATYDGFPLAHTENFGGSPVQDITVDGAVPLLLEFDRPYGDSATIMEILAFQNGSLVGLAKSGPHTERGNPWVGLELYSGTYQIAIERVRGYNPVMIKEIVAGDGIPVEISGENVGTVYGHAMTPGVIAAGAVSAAETPASGVNPAVSEIFSSSGAGTQLLFSNGGAPLSPPLALSPVAVSGVDDIQTTVPNGLSDFYGTSAASASLAGVAALMLSANPNLSPAQVEQIMEQTASPMANSAVSGAGLVQVDPAVADAAATPGLESVSGAAEAARVGGMASLATAAAASHAGDNFSLQYKGFDYVAFYNGAYENSDSLPSLTQTGANSIEATVDYGINAQTSQVVADPNYTDSLSALGATIAQAESLGLSVMVRPLIDFLNPTESAPYSVGEWRQDYQPTDVATFFASYKQMIVSEAEVAQANGAQMLSIGAELDQLTGPQYLPYWTNIINSVHAVFSGELTYSASWNTASEVSFWNQLNYEGIDCYVPLSDAANPTLRQLVRGWLDPATPTHDPGAYDVIGNQSPIQYFENLSAQSGKQLIFTELGYANDTGAAADPAASGANPDPTLQARLYKAFFEAWDISHSSSLVGTYFWEWDPDGSSSNVGPGIDSFSPQNSPAQHQATVGFENDSGALASHLAALHINHLLH